MSATKEAALALSHQERLELIEVLWESLRAELGDAIPVDAQTKQELDRRLQSHAADGTTSTWDEIKARALGLDRQ